MDKLNKFFSNQELINLLPEFLNVYKKRPFPENHGGMGINHSFALFALIKKLDISTIYESGIYRGHSTWLIENTKDDIKLVSIDIDLKLRDYISTKKNTTYHEGDLEDLDLSECDFSKTLFFFDDHVNVMSRLKFLFSWGAKYAVFEDNYPVGEGDAYSIRKIKSCTGQSLNEWFKDYKKPYIPNNKYLKKIHNRIPNNFNSLPFFLDNYFYYQNKLREPNTADLKLFKKIVKSDYEIQPIYNYKKQRWGQSWTGNFKSLDPLFLNLDENFILDYPDLDYLLETFNNFKSIYHYTYFAFLELNQR